MTLKTSLLCRLVILVSAMAGIAGSCYANTIVVEQPMSSGLTSWTSAFDIVNTEKEIVIEIGVSLMVPKNINRALLEDNIAAWNTAIDSTWNNRFNAHIDQEWLPVRINVKFSHFRPHHRVIIHPGKWVANQHNWYIDMPANIVAHEIGHMLGAFDEYKGGALSPLDPIVDFSSIMGPRPGNGLAYPRHLLLLTKKLTEHFDNKKIKIVAY